MSDRPRLLRLLAELDQQLAEAEDCFAELSLTISESTLRTEIVDGLQAALANVEWQLTRDRIDKIGDRCLTTDRPPRLGMFGKPEPGDGKDMINEFIAAPDAQATLESVLRQLQSSCTNPIADVDHAKQRPNPRPGQGDARKVRADVGLPQQSATPDTEQGLPARRPAMDKR